MVIASIDIQKGKVVQLKKGSELILEKDNVLEVAEDFNKYGEVAVIDLDAALGLGENTEIIKPLLRKAECRVGGGIRTAKQARELVSFGAKKIIVGTAALRNTEGKSGLNTDFLEQLAEAVGKDRIILAVDAASSETALSGYEIVVDGWKTRTSLDLVETACLAEKYVSEFLLTCIDNEGTLSGINLEPVMNLRELVSCKVTAASGVKSLEEIETLARYE